MNQLAIKLENVSKLYRLGEVGTGTLAHDLNRWWAKMRGRPDPTLAIGTSNNREETGGDYAWALRKIDLEVQKGEILGIIGRNGSAISTRRHQFRGLHLLPSTVRRDDFLYDRSDPWPCWSRRVPAWFRRTPEPYGAFLHGCHQTRRPGGPGRRQ